MPTYKQVVNHVKKHVLWKDEYFERYYRLNPELVQKRLDKIYQAEDDLMVLISTQLFCFLQANGTLYFDGCYKTGKADNSLLCTNFGARYLRGIQIPAFIMRRRIVSLPRTRP